MSNYFNMFLHEVKNDLDLDLKNTIKNKVIPIYNKSDKGHNWENHIKPVVDISLELAKIIEDKRNIVLNKNIVYASAAFHDITRHTDGVGHELTGGKYVRRNKKFFSRWFSNEEIEIIAQAVEDHRASVGANPRSVYGGILFDSDRISGLDIKTMLMRSWYFGLQQHPELTTEQQFERIYKHLVDKWGVGGYADKMATPEGDKLSKSMWKNARRALKNKDLIRKIFYNMLENGEIEKS